MALHKRLILLILLIGSCLSGLLSLGNQVKGLPARLTVDKTTHLVDSYGWYHVFGEFNNTGSGTLNGVIQFTTTFTSGYSLLAIVNTYTMLDLVKSGENASFNVVLANATKSSQPNIAYSFASSFIQRNNIPVRLNATQTSNSTDSSGNFHVVGTVKNNYTAPVTFVKVIATFYTATNIVAYADWVYSNPINLTIGDSGTFDMIALNSTTHAKITRTKLQVQCNEYVSATAADFSLETLQRTQTVTQGGSVTYDIRTCPNSVLDYSAMTLSATGLPQGATATFFPPVVTNASKPTRITLNITTSSAIGVGVGDFQIVVTAQSGTSTRSAPLILTVTARTDFELTISPPSRSVSQGNQAVYTVTATSGGGFSSLVTLNYSNIPTGSTANFSTNPITPTPTGATTTFRISTSLSTALGTKVFSVCGRGGSPEKSHCATAIVAVTASTAPSFSLSMTPDERTVLRDSSTNFTVTVTSVNDFDESVTLKLTGNPSGTSGTFSPNPVTPPGSGTVQSTLNITTTSAPLYGTYTITVNGTSSGFPSSLAQATLIVSSLSEPDFALYVFPSTLSIVQNKSGTATIQIVSVNNFEESVTLTLQDIPTGVTHSFANPTVAPLPGGYVNTKLTLQTSSSTSLGNYTLTLKGSGSSKNHTASLVLFVTSGARCIIATATYGSELSPEVQFLRGFRDNRVLSTSGGREFMKVFNAWYYSFSPQVASWIAGNPSAREPFKMLLMPLLGILHLSEISYSTVAFAPEIAVILAGIVASSLIGVVYLGPILAVTCRRMSYKSRRRLLDWATLASAVSISLLAIGLLTSTPLLVMLTSSLLVLSTVTIGSWSVPIAASRILDRCRKTTV